MNQEFSTDVKLTASELKLGTGMNPEVEKCFEEPMFKTSKVTVGAAGLKKRKILPDKDLQVGEGGGSRPKKKMIGRGLKFT